MQSHIQENKDCDRIISDEEIKEPQQFQSSDSETHQYLQLQTEADITESIEDDCDSDCLDGDAIGGGCGGPGSGQCDFLEESKSEPAEEITYKYKIDFGNISCDLRSEVLKSIQNQIQAIYGNYI